MEPLLQIESDSSELQSKPSVMALFSPGQQPRCFRFPGRARRPRTALIYDSLCRAFQRRGRGNSLLENTRVIWKMDVGVTSWSLRLSIHPLSRKLSKTWEDVFHVALAMGTLIEGADLFASRVNAFPCSEESVSLHLLLSAVRSSHSTLDHRCLVCRSWTNQKWLEYSR